MKAAPGGQCHPSPWDAGGVLRALLPLLGGDPLALCVNRSVDAGRTRRDPGACTRVCTHRDAAPHRGDHRPSPCSAAGARGGAPVRCGVMQRWAGPPCPRAVGAFCALGCVGGPGSLFGMPRLLLFCTPGLFCSPGVMVFSAPDFVLDTRFALHYLVVLHPGCVLYPEFVLHHITLFCTLDFLFGTLGWLCTLGLFCSVPRVRFVLPFRSVSRGCFALRGCCYALRSSVTSGRVLLPGLVLHPGFALRVGFRFPSRSCFLRLGCFSALVSVVYHSCFCLFCTLVSVTLPAFFWQPVSGFHSRFYFAARVLF